MKEALRQRIRPAPVPAAMSAAIQSRLLEQDWWAAAFAVGLYRATPSEPATDALLADLLARGAQVAVPVRHARGYRWGWVDAATRWHKGAFGILEPLRAPQAAPDRLRVVLVPGLAFDARGGRLGHGRGHFDRLLSQTGGLLVGLCMEQRLVEAVPLEPHDIPMDAVATEKRMIFAPSAAAKLERLIG
jgi:5-formyltetrahydrofolate cyclo-ligase